MDAQGSLSGCAQFSGRDGRPGAAVFAAGVGAAGSEWERMAVEDEALRAAAEVVIGRADLQDLTGLGVPTLKADQVYPYPSDSVGKGHLVLQLSLWCAADGMQLSIPAPCGLLMRSTSDKCDVPVREVLFCHLQDECVLA